MPSNSPSQSGDWNGFRRRADKWLRAGMEILVLAMVCLAPWGFGAVEPGFEFLLYAGIALLLILWGARIVLEWRFCWKKCPVALCLAGLFLSGVGQIVPLPRSWLDRLCPATARVYDQLLPAQPEVLPLGEARATIQPPPGSTISFYPGATRPELLRLLAVLLLFTAVRANIASAGALWRLSIACLANGALLALFGLIQFCSSPHHTVYWSLPSEGQVFGPFICRNHFSFYVNVCLGLGAGLLFRSKLSFRAEDRTKWSLGNIASGIFEDPWALWVVTALGLMLAGVALCLSRGGLLALAGGMALCLIIKRMRSPRFSGLGYLFLTLAIGLLVVGWFGFATVEARLATLWKETAFHSSRGTLWARILLLVKDYPFLGTGYGTFQYVEPLTRTSPTEASLVYDHAHNDYLEVLVEGGLVGLLLSVLAVGLVFCLGYRAFCRYEGSSVGGLALGGLFGLGTVAIHTFGDFGLHVPAIAVLVAVVCANLCSLGSDGRTSGRRDAESRSNGREYRLFLGGLAPILAGATALGLAWIVYTEGRRADLVHRYRLAAFRSAEATGKGGSDLRINYLEQAVRLAPDYAGLQVELAVAYLDRYQTALSQWHAKIHSGDAALAVIAAVSPYPSGMAQAVSVADTTLIGALAFQERFANEQEQLARKHLLPSLGHFLQARDLCPLMSQPHQHMAAHCDFLEAGDRRSAYLSRAKLLMAPDPEIWYRSGFQELEDENQEEAWKSWRRCLELSDRYLPLIALQVSERPLDAAAIIGRLLPNKPALLVAAAGQFYPDAVSAELRRPFLQKALELLENQTPPVKAEDLHTMATIHGSLGQTARALAAYRRALDQKPDQAEWRLELARLLHQQGFVNEARKETLLVLGEQPTPEARQLLLRIEDPFAARRDPKD
jgi:O-antigen ligase/tetratricopeptide (TPR) repeat protein